MSKREPHRFREPCKPSQGLVGKRFGKLLVIDRDGKQGNNARWLCRCDCGKTCHKTTQRLNETRKAGGTSSCGCHAAYLSRQHGLAVKARVEAARQAKLAAANVEASAEAAALDLARLLGLQ